MWRESRNSCISFVFQKYQNICISKMCDGMEKSHSGFNLPVPYLYLWRGWRWQNHCSGNDVRSVLSGSLLHFRHSSHCTHIWSGLSLQEPALSLSIWSAEWTPGKAALNKHLPDPKAIPAQHMEWFGAASTPLPSHEHPARGVVSPQQPQGLTPQVHISVPYRKERSSHPLTASIPPGDTSPSRADWGKHGAFNAAQDQSSGKLVLTLLRELHPCFPSLSVASLLSSSCWVSVPAQRSSVWKEELHKKLDKSHWHNGQNKEQPGQTQPPSPRSWFRLAIPGFRLTLLCHPPHTCQKWTHPD